MLSEEKFTLTSGFATCLDVDAGMELLAPDTTMEPLYTGHPWSENKVAFTEGWLL